MKHILLGLLLAGSSAMAAEFKLASTAFENREEIPENYTCDGANISPQLSWRGAPKNTKAFALIVDDPDVPNPEKPEKVTSLWILYNIPADVRSLEEGLITLPRGTLAGPNEDGKPTYLGPCPAEGRHRYFFKIFALSSTVHFFAKPTKADLEKSFTGKILAQAELIGTYAKKANQDK